MRKVLFILIGLCIGIDAPAQELFIQTEPASNMPAERFGARLTSDVFSENNRSLTRIGAEIMYGVSKELMVHLQGFGLSRIGQFQPETIGLYAKYRLYADDGFKYHFRIAAYGEGLLGRQDNTMPNVSFKGGGPQVNAGMVFTLLENRLALSSTIGGSKALSDIILSDMQFENIVGVNASLSAGYLLYPNIYSGYSDPNINLYAELLSYHSWYDHTTHHSMAAQGSEAILSLGPQLIINAVLRFDLAYSMVLYSDYSLRRSNSLFARVEYNFY